MVETCWIWPGAKDKDGYGKLGNGRAHRLVYEAAFGPIPVGLNLLHECDHPPCFNPYHLFPGTQAENIADRDAKGRRSPAQRGKPLKLTQADVDFIRSSDQSQRELSDVFGVAQPTISRIRNGRRWPEQGVPRR